MIFYYRPILIKFFVCLSLLLQLSCDTKAPEGSIFIAAPGPGTYEVYRIASETPLQFVSEQIGHFNRDLALPVGSYLILADCSHQQVTIRPNKQERLVAHQVKFIPPFKPHKDDIFSIQCDRYAKTRSKQNLRNRFQLNILDGHRELLVSMVPFELDIPKGDKNSKTPQSFAYNLSAVQLKSYENMDPTNRYFVSPADGLISVTKDQSFGRWQFLLPGRYNIEVNGTRSTVILEAGQTESISPAYLKVTADPSVDLDLSSTLLGTPLYVELNDGHWLDLNRTYPLLPGKAHIKLNGSYKNHEVELESDKLVEKFARSVVVSFDCPPWEWTCFGNHKVYLYNKEKAYPFAEGISDIPILFFEEDVWVSIQGSRDIRYQLKEGKNNFTLAVGEVTFKPSYQYRPNQLTDLSRVEAIQIPYEGHTLDLPNDRDVTIPLIAGSYHLAQYTSVYNTDYERRQQKRWFHIKAHEKIDIRYQVLVQEKKLKGMKESLAKKRERSERRRSQLSSSMTPIIPVQPR